MNPKQFIRYIQMLDKRGLAICDGISESGFDSILPVLYMTFGLGIFLLIMVFFDKIKLMIFRKK